MKIGHKLRGGEAIELSGDLGAGKTAFVRGLAKGAGSKDNVHSPSFTISNVYRAGKLDIYHFDFYRLEDPGIMRRELAETLEDPAAVVAVEWGAAVKSVLPARRLAVRINAATDSGRHFEFSYPPSLSYLIPGAR
jgi:tRNA threonylcarbamoyladenosine biosynthesis protein TsaE